MKKKKRAIDERTRGDDTCCTPRWFIQGVARFSRSGRIGLDPAGAAKAKRAAASTFSRVVYRLSEGRDGLALSWRRRGLVFVNPPYGTQVRKWAAKATTEFPNAPAAKRGIDELMNADELIMLVAARVDTRWFKLLWRHASAVLLCDKRFTFDGETDPAKFPQAVLYFGTRPFAFGEHFGKLGLVIARAYGHEWAVSTNLTFSDTAPIIEGQVTWPVSKNSRQSISRQNNSRTKRPSRVLKHGRVSRRRGSRAA